MSFEADRANDSDRCSLCLAEFKLFHHIAESRLATPVNIAFRGEPPRQRKMIEIVE